MLVAEDDLSRASMRWVVAVDGVGAVHSEYRDHGDRTVVDPVLDPVHGQWAEAFHRAGADGVVGQVGEVGVDLEPDPGWAAAGHLVRPRRRTAMPAADLDRVLGVDGVAALGVDPVEEVGQVGGVRR